MAAFLVAHNYRHWNGDAAVRPTAQHGGARTYFSPELQASLQRNDRTHPVGSMAVREVYAPDLTTLRGWGVALKTAEKTLPGSWYWFESFNLESAAPLVADHGAPGCVSCHSSGTDFIQVM